MLDTTYPLARSVPLRLENTGLNPLRGVNIDVYWDGIVIATVPNTGVYADSAGDIGRAMHTYKVCEAGTMTCQTK